MIILILVLSCYLDHLKINSDYDGKDLINTFYSDVRDYGFFESFKRALFKLNFCGIYSDEMNTLKNVVSLQREFSSTMEGIRKNKYKKRKF